MGPTEFVLYAPPTEEHGQHRGGVALLARLLQRLPERRRQGADDVGEDQQRRAGA